MKERIAASSGMKGKRATSWLVTAFDLCNPSRWRMCMWCVFTLIWSPVPQQLASFPGPKTGRGYSAVSFSDPAQLHRFSVPECWVGPGNEATLVSQDYMYLSSCTSSMSCFLFCPGLTQPAFFLFCCFNSAARCHVRFYISFLGSSVVCGVLHGSLREHDCAVSTPPKASLWKFSYQLPLRFTLETWLWEIRTRLSLFSNFHNQLSLFNKYETKCTNTYVHTYIRTDTTCVQHINVGLAQACPNKLSFWKYAPFEQRPPPSSTCIGTFSSYICLIVSVF